MKADIFNVMNIRSFNRYSWPWWVDDEIDLPENISLGLCSFLRTITEPLNWRSIAMVITQNRRKLCYWNISLSSFCPRYQSRKEIFLFWNDKGFKDCTKLLDGSPMKLNLQFRSDLHLIFPIQAWSPIPFPTLYNVTYDPFITWVDLMTPPWNLILHASVETRWPWAGRERERMCVCVCKRVRIQVCFVHVCASRKWHGPHWGRARLNICCNCCERAGGSFSHYGNDSLSGVSFPFPRTYSLNLPMGLLFYPDRLELVAKVPLLLVVVGL